MSEYETLATRLENYIHGENYDDVPVRTAEAAVAIRELLKQLAHVEADYQVRNEQACSRWEEIQKLREQLVKARDALKLASPIISDRAAGGRMLTSKEEASKAFRTIQAALTDEKRHD